MNGSELMAKQHMEFGSRLRLGQHLGNRPYVEPPLFLWPLMDGVDHTREIFQAVELHLSGLQAEKDAGRGRFACFSDEKFNAGGCQSRSEDTIEWCGVAPLLQVPEDSLANIEQSLAFLGKKGGNEIGRIQGLGVLTPDHEAQPLPMLKAFDQ